MTIETDIKELCQKYGDKRGIRTADQIMRVVEALQQIIQVNKDCDCYADFSKRVVAELERMRKPTPEKLDKIIKFVKENP